MLVKRAFLLLLALLLLLAGAVAVNTLRQGSRQTDVPPTPEVAVDERGVAERLAGAVRFKTVSSQDDPGFNEDQFRALHAYLAQHYPRVHGTLQRGGQQRADSQPAPPHRLLGVGEPRVGGVHAPILQPSS